MKSKEEIYLDQINESRKFDERLAKVLQSDALRKFTMNCLIVQGTEYSNLINAQKKYIEFLGKNISDNSVYLQVHNMGASQETVEEGERLRAEILKYM